MDGELRPFWVHFDDLGGEACVMAVDEHHAMLSATMITMRQAIAAFVLPARMGRVLNVNDGYRLNGCHVPASCAVGRLCQGASGCSGHGKPRGDDNPDARLDRAMRINDLDKNKADRQRRAIAGLGLRNIRDHPPAPTLIDIQYMITAKVSDLLAREGLTLGGPIEVTQAGGILQVNISAVAVAPAAFTIELTNAIRQYLPVGIELDIKTEKSR